MMAFRLLYSIFLQCDYRPPIQSPLIIYRFRTVILSLFNHHVNACWTIHVSIYAVFDKLHLKYMFFVFFSLYVCSSVKVASSN